MKHPDTFPVKTAPNTSADAAPDHDEASWCAPRLRRPGRRSSRMLHVLHRRVTRLAGALVGLVLATASVPADPCLAVPPPADNVHLVTRGPHQTLLWRGAAPRRETVEALVRAARSRGVILTLVDLRQPDSSDDRSGKRGRLAPRAEETMARQVGAHYLRLSALDRALMERLDAALLQGDVYLHCMYGVNRTGFAIGRYGRHRGMVLTRTGLCSSDWQCGAEYETRLVNASRHR